MRPKRSRAQRQAPWMTAIASTTQEAELGQIRSSRPPQACRSPCRSCFERCESRRQTDPPCARRDRVLDVANRPMKEGRSRGRRQLRRSSPIAPWASPWSRPPHVAGRQTRHCRLSSCPMRRFPPWAWSPLLRSCSACGELRPCLPATRDGSADPIVRRMGARSPWVRSNCRALLRLGHSRLRHPRADPPGGLTGIPATLVVPSSLPTQLLARWRSQRRYQERLLIRRLALHTQLNSSFAPSRQQI